MTSTAVRPLYQPQLGHTTWGSLEVAHWGHTLRAGRARVQLDARRLRVLALLVLRLGTGIDLHFHQKRAYPSLRGSLGLGVRKLEPVQCSPPGILWRLAVARRLVAIDPALGAQARAVGPTERRERQVQEDGVVDQWG